MAGGSSSREGLAAALDAVEGFAAPGTLTSRIGALERDLAGLTRKHAAKALLADGIDATLLRAALDVRRCRRAGVRMTL